MSMRRILVPLFVFVLLAGCTQTSQPQGPSQPQTQPQIPQLPIGGGGVNVAAQLSELGISLTGTSDAIMLKAKYPALSVAGQNCQVELQYDMSTCSASAPTKSGNQYSFCKPPYQYKLTSTCDLSSIASELNTDPHLNGKKFTTDIWLPWYESSSDLLISITLGKAPSKVMYLYATGDYQSSYPNSGTYLKFKDPSKYIIVEGSNADQVMDEVRTAVGSNEYKISDTILNYIPSEWYGATVVPYICYNPNGIITADYGEFDWKSNRLNLKFEQDKKLLSPSSFVVSPVSASLGGKQLESIGQPFSKLEPYQSHYKACKLSCYETCEREGILVMMKGDCSTVAPSVSGKPPIAAKFDTILTLLSKVKTFSSMKDFVCFGLINPFGEDILLRDKKTGKGFVYARPVIVDKGVEIVIAEDIADAKAFIEYMIKDKLNAAEGKYVLRTKKTSGNCKLYDWGNPSDFQGFAGYCSELDGLTFMFFNICPQGENCEPSATALFGSLT